MKLPDESFVALDAFAADPHCDERERAAWAAADGFIDACLLRHTRGRGQLDGDRPQMQTGVWERRLKPHIQSNGRQSWYGKWHCELLIRRMCRHEYLDRLKVTKRHDGLLAGLTWRTTVDSQAEPIAILREIDQRLRIYYSDEFVGRFWLVTAGEESIVDAARALGVNEDSVRRVFAEMLRFAKGDECHDE